MEVDVDVVDQSGKMLADIVKNEKNTEAVIANSDGADAEIAQILSQHSGKHSRTVASELMINASTHSASKTAANPTSNSTANEH